MRLGDTLRSLRSRSAGPARSDPGAPSSVGVLFLHTATRPPLGADTWVQGQIIAGLDKASNRVFVACAGSDSATTPTRTMVAGIAGITIVATNLGPELSDRSPASKGRAAIATLAAPLSMLRLVRLIRSERIQWVHTTDRPRDAFAAVVLARLTAARCMIHAHVAFDARWMSPMLQRSMQRADALVAISDYVASSLRESGHRADRIHVVKNATDLQRWTPGIDRDSRRAELECAAEDVLIITVARLFPAKGPAELIRAVATVRATGRRARLVIVGHEMIPGYAAELRRVVTEVGLDDHVVFTGRRSDVAALMAAADIFAMPSMFEPFGLVYLEAMAMERPVVALDNGGTPEVVEHGVTGLLSAAGDIAAFASNLMTLIDDAGLRAAMGRAGRARVERDFTQQRLGHDMGRLYRQLEDAS
jgi:glycosyltransferase involved in cell wall biosynthesis